MSEEEPINSPWWAPASFALSFLTICPTPRIKVVPRVVSSSIAAFPVVGALLGIILGLIGILCERFLAPGPTAVIIIACGTFVTGGLHFDGLMDTADGVLGVRTVERRLEVMRDSRVGAFGVLAGVLALLGQYACLGTLADLNLLEALAVAIGLSRWAMTVAIITFPPARPDGLGAMFHPDVPRKSFVFATVVAIAIGFTLGSPGIIVVLGTGIATAACGWFFQSRLGGLTGDTYGAIAVITETLVLYAFSAGLVT